MVSPKCSRRTFLFESANQNFPVGEMSTPCVGLPIEDYPQVFVSRQRDPICACPERIPARENYPALRRCSGIVTKEGSLPRHVSEISRGPVPHCGLAARRCRQTGIGGLDCNVAALRQRQRLPSLPSFSVVLARVRSTRTGKKRNRLAPSTPERAIWNS